MVIQVIENPNFLGELFILSKTNNPYLEMVGGLNGGALRVVSGLEFAEGVYAVAGAGSQPALSETDVLTAPASTDFSRTNSVNTVQYFQRTINVSYPKQSVPGFVSADPTTGLLDASQPMNVRDEKAFQIEMNLMGITNDVEFVGLRGEYAQQTAAGVAPKCRGLLPHTATNVIASTGDLKADVNKLLKKMVDNRAPLRQCVILVGAFQKQQISKQWGYAPMDRNVGGLNLKQLETDFAVLPVLYVPNMDPSVLEVAEMSVVRPVALPVPGKGILFYEELAKTGASERGQLYGQIGWDYGPEVFHGKITGLATA